jgi:RNA recognition motif-containing protein
MATVSPLGASQRPQFLRDGVPASPREVVDAIKEYHTRLRGAQPPPGCAPDAVKLFVGNIPKHCNEAVLNKVFQHYGHVVEIAVV